MGMKIYGLDELDDFLRTSPAELANGPVRKALKAGGAVIQAAIVERAPVLLEPESPGSDALPPGAIKSDIIVKITVAQGGGTAIIEPGKFTLHVARWVEYGHRMVRGGYSRVIGKGPNAGKLRGPGKELERPVPPYPFIRPAVEASIEKARTLMNDVFGKEMMKIANRKLRKGGSPTRGKAA